MRQIRPERQLRVKRIKPKTVLLYDDHVTGFLAWMKQNRKRGTDSDSIDRHMSIYFNLLFEDGEGYNVASYTLFGWIALRMVPRQPEKDLLPLARAALSAWRGLSPGRTRVGVPPQVIYHFAAFCIQERCFEAAAAVLLQYDLYARRSEVLSSRGRDLVSPVPSLNSHWGVIIGNSDFDETTKTKTTDDIVLADSTHRQYANKLLRCLGKFFLHRDVPVFNVSLSQYEEIFRRFSKKHKLACGLFTPHCIRHSGPSYDAIHAHRSFLEIQSRGRWACAASINRYKKPGRLLLEASRLPSALKHFDSAALETSLTSLLSHRWVTL